MARYELKQVDAATDTWSVIDTTTGEPAVVEGVNTAEMPLDDARMLRTQLSQEANDTKTAADPSI